MDLVTLFLGYIKTVLLILIPFTWAYGKLLKNCLQNEKFEGVSGFVKKVVKDTSNIKPVLYITNFLLAMIIGFIDTSATGWRFYVEPVVIYGFFHGVVVTFMATRLYDLVRR